MSISSLQSTIDRLQRDIADLNKKMSQELKNEGTLVGRLNSAQSSIRGNISASTLESKLREIARYNDDLSKIAANKSDLGKKLADKTKDLNRAQQDLGKEQESESKKQQDGQKKLEELNKKRHKEQLEREKALTAEVQRQGQVSRQAQALSASQGTPAPDVEYDFFISHASEDKEELVRPLAQALTARGFSVWYDEMTLKVGDSLRRSIDRGLSNSRFGVVVLSNAFFAKNWTNYELNGLNAKEMEGAKVILPVWHKISKNEVMKQSPALADKVALNSSTYSVEELADQLAEVLGD